MKLDNINQAVARVEERYLSKPGRGPVADIPATATIEKGLKCRIESPDGKSVYTDMPEAVGGSGSAGSPGWLLRAAVASCDATLLTMRAARLGLNLESVEVRVEAMSDGRGMFLDEGISPGSSQMQICFNVKAPGVSEEEIRDLVKWVSDHAPVGADIAQAVNVEVIIENL